MNLNLLIQIFFVLSLLPVEILSSPAPLAPISFSFILILLINQKSNLWFLASICLCAYALFLATFSFLETGSKLPYLSALSFCLPISGLWVGLHLGKYPEKLEFYIQLAIIPVVIFSAALLKTMLIYGANIRGSTLHWNVIDGEFYASTALGDLFGFPFFAALGVNSFAGIVFSFLILSLLILTITKNKNCFWVVCICTLILFAYGFLLHSRSFIVGIATFCLSILWLRSRNWLVAGASILLMLPIITYALLLDERIAGSYEQFLDNGLLGLTTNRLNLWLQFLQNSELFFGTKFKQINFSETLNSSYHMYLLTAFGKGGILFGFPLTALLIFPLRGASLCSSAPHLSIFYSSHLAFLVQSLVWDIYAVQLYGHMAWICVGVLLAVLINQRKKNQSTLG
jgi:hypothetical protein